MSLELVEAGEGGRPLLLCHGFTGCKEDFEDFIEPLADRGWHVVAPDNRGHGGSDRPTGEHEYSLRRFAEDKLALAEALGWERFALLGHSMGGMFAQELALLAPERLTALVLMDTSHRRIVIDTELRDLGVALARAGEMDTIADALQAASDGPLTTEAGMRLERERPELAARGDRNVRAVAADMYAAMLLELTEHDSRLGALADLAVPTLVIVGEQDTPFVGQSRDLASTIPGARLAIIPDAGHCPQFEAPDAWWGALSGFLDEVAAPTPATAGPAGGVIA